MIGCVAVAQGVAGGDVLEAEPGDDVAGHRDVEVFALVGVHQQDAAEPLALLLGRVVDLFALADLARVDPEVGELAERVGDDLERQRRERLVVRAAVDVLVAAHVGAVGGRDVERRRQEVDDGVEHRLHALVLERRAAQDRHEVVADRALADRALDLGHGELLTAEVLLHQVLVLGGDRLEQVVAVLRRLVGHVGRDLDLVPLGAELLVAPHEGDVADEVDETDERLVRLGTAAADRELDDERIGLQARLHHVDGAVEVGADPVHLVDEAEARHAVLVGLAPDGLGLGLDTGDRVEHGDGAVEHTQRALDLDREVDVAGGVDDVDAVVVPDAGRRRRRDRDAALLLLDHVVHRRRAVVDLADLVALPGVVEDALRRGGLAGIDVGHDADVAGALEGELTLGHRQITSVFFGSNSQGAAGPMNRARNTIGQCTGPAYASNLVEQR